MNKKVIRICVVCNIGEFKCRESSIRKTCCTACSTEYHKRYMSVYYKTYGQRPARRQKSNDRAKQYWIDNKEEIKRKRKIKKLNDKMKTTMQKETNVYPIVVGHDTMMGGAKVVGSFFI